MPRYIDADFLYESMNGQDGEFSMKDALWMIENFPSEDVQKVIRCQECSNRHTDDCPMYFEEWYEWDEDGYTERDYIIHDYSSDNGFCDKAERRNDEP